MLPEFPSDARGLLQRPNPNQPFCEKARVIQKYIRKLERPVMPNHEHPLCDVYNDDVAVGIACISTIRWEISEVDAKLPRAIHSRIGSIGAPLLEWCLWVLKDMSFAFSNCHGHNTIRVPAANDALVVLNSFISDPRGLQLVLRRKAVVVDIVVHAWASVAGLAICRDAVVPVTLLLDKLHNTPQLHDRVVESLAQYTPAVPLQIIRHIAAFSHRDFEPLPPDPALERAPVEVHIDLLTQLCRIHHAIILMTHNGPTWMCRALARVLTIPFEDWEGAGEMLMNPFMTILAFFKTLFELDPSLVSMKAALRHQLVRSLVRCLSEVSRQKRLGQGYMKNPSCAPVLDAVILQVCVGVRTSGTILRLACRAMDTLNLAEEENERFISKDDESAMSWAAWDVLKDSISRARMEWVVDPNVRSGWRCMNPLCSTPYAHRLKRCTECQFLVVCSRACQKYMWTALDHRSRCFNFASCSLAVEQNDEGHDGKNCRCQRFTLI